jgi:hypothetical protein
MKKSKFALELRSMGKKPSIFLAALLEKGAVFFDLA